MNPQNSADQAVGAATTISGVDFLGSAELGTIGNDSRAFIGAGGLLLAAFLMDVALQIYRAQQGERADFKGAIGRLIIFTVLIGSYVTIAGWISAVVTQYGSMKSADQSILALRAQAFSGHLMDSAAEEAAGMIELAAAKALEVLFQAAVWVSYIFAAGVIYGLGLIQRAALSFLITIGPLFIALSAFPWRPLRGLVVAWVMATIEIGIWGVAANALSRLMKVSFKHLALSPEAISPNLAEHFVFNIMYAFAFLSVPIIVNALMSGRGTPGSVSSVAAFAGAAQGAATGAGGGAIAVGGTAAAAAATGARYAGIAGASSASGGSMSQGGPNQQRPGD